MLYDLRSSATCFRLLSRPKLALVETALPVVDALLPRADLRLLLVPFQPPTCAERPADRHGRLLMRFVRHDEGCHAYHGGSHDPHIRPGSLGDRPLWKYMVSAWRRYRFYVHDHGCLVSRSGELR